MTREDFDNLLQELTTEELTTERQLEIFSELQNDKQNSLDNYNALLESSEKVMKEYNSLKQKTVEDFFKVGKEFKPSSNDDVGNKETETKVKSYDEIVKDMLGGK